ncbi:cell division protein FtsQ/DivIB [Facilibium subflavum]|uniref:cell division protein FtsQ/DivIB n=1 Tax=Facilibium subflavum TaxID=2219058 RepID=UPI0013C2AEB1|nr:cell division protein FtsQ/DivIB [Facilibium subflavum]
MLIYHYTQSNAATLAKVEVQSTQPLMFISQKAVIDMVKPYQKDTWFGLDVKSLSEKLLAYPGIKSVRVTKTWPNKLSITFAQYTPVAYWQNHQQILLDNDEIITPKYFQQKGEKVELPLFDGQEYNKKQMKTMYDALYQITSKHQLQIEQLRYHGNQWSVVLSNKITIMLGSENMMQKLQTLLSHLSEIIVPDHKVISEIDMRYRRGFAVQLSTK